MKEIVFVVLSALAAIAAHAETVTANSSASAHLGSSMHQQAAEKVYGNLQSNSLKPIEQVNSSADSRAHQDPLTRQQAIEKVYGNLHSNSLKPISR
ncbi:hypothetical protein [Paraburkholderia sp. MM6662-R1]|uniref:hypothetical protein n=1 Tax=Paraburkholderia sp. MM6662-R1 TaxID=2991066 RepID=UPI003D24FB8B